jgi:hypothetical protein
MHCSWRIKDTVLLLKKTQLSLRSGVNETAEFSGDLYFVDLAMSMSLT